MPSHKNIFCRKSYRYEATSYATLCAVIYRAFYTSCFSTAPTTQANSGMVKVFSTNSTGFNDMHEEIWTWTYE
ncbi:CLUMA_CG015038, isoform A [Clunio marinus]|uniref:CLUMA_CG015038, isoform A n=1 Tax=Clunio marinus TaxID=568069 RepID=A0A1J1INL6_9DIPT|nr:CLUMA_CG015038, isoform A [Clunio marinus]